jgi:hypothetical protein
VSAGADDALAAVEQTLDRGGEPDDALRGVVQALVERGGCAWAGILFREEGEYALGPEAGHPRPAERTQLPVVFQGDHVADLVVDGCDDRALLERVAVLISAYCLVGWDTGGVPWDSVR